MGHVVVHMAACVIVVIRIIVRIALNPVTLVASTLCARIVGICARAIKFAFVGGGDK